MVALREHKRVHGSGLRCSIFTSKDISLEEERQARLLRGSPVIASIAIHFSLSSISSIFLPGYSLPPPYLDLFES